MTGEAASADILQRAARHEFLSIGDWLAVFPKDVNVADQNGWTVLHHAAAAESTGRDVEDIVNMLLQAGANPHQPDKKGDTPFNIAAANAPVAGRLMTIHWLDEALMMRGAKRINDRSGSHGSTLAQYMAKWLRDDEIDAQLRRAVEAGMKPDIANASGWTPLTAAAAMGRVKAVTAYMEHYDHAALSMPTTEAYTAVYNGHQVVFPAGMTAAEIAFTRLGADKGLSQEQKDAFAHIAALVLFRLSGHGGV